MHDLLNMNNNECYPTCLHNCTIINKNEMLLLKQGLDNNIVFVRGIKIEEQLSANIPNEENGAGAMVVNLSQDTEHMLLSDMEHVIQNENDRTDSLNTILTSIDTIKAEKVLEIRELMNILESDKDLMLKFNTEFDALRSKYIGLASSNKLKRNIGEISFSFTGECKKRHDLRKR